MLTKLTINRRFKAVVNQFLCFSGVGIIGTLAHYLTLIGMVEIVSMRPVFSSILGFIVGALVNYFLNYHVTFKSAKSHHEAMPKFFVVALVGLAMNAMIMSVATEVLRFHYLLAQVISTGVVLIWNFTGNRLWTFWERTNER
jgi:putative flippase GtrA